MSNNQSVKTTEADTAASGSTFSQRLSNCLHDPFASAMAATLVTTLAFGFVISGMWIVNSALT